MNIRPANTTDFDRLYEIGKTTIEFRVSAILKFMEKQGFAIGHKYAWVDKELK
jgi:hypothetical protein